MPEIGSQSQSILQLESLALYGMKVCPVVIFARAAHGDAGNIGQAAVELDPDGKAAHEVMELYSHIVIQLRGSPSWPKREAH